MAKNKLKFDAINEFGEDTKEFDEAFKKYQDELQEINGLFFIPDEVSKSNKDYFVTNKYENNTGYTTFSKVEDAYINAQIEYYIQQKYNFIHYNGWPNITKQKEIEENADINEFLNPEEATRRLTHNGKIAKKLLDNLKENEKDGIHSPFKEEVIVIDEIHNLINMINNKKPIASQFYEWIKNSVDTKLVFLSGTPIVNEPCEIAILYNMLKGKQDIFNFTINADKNNNELENLLKHEFFKKKSSIEQFHISKKRGKTIISVIKNKSNFASILDNNIVKTVKFSNLDTKFFLNEVYDGLKEIFDKDLITPKKTEIE